ncbi:MAG: hypothetical protein Q7R52_03595 [archaeon]|nr:hypothetical protein [archaeon]
MNKEWKSMLIFMGIFLIIIISIIFYLIPKEKNTKESIYKNNNFSFTGDIVYEENQDNLTKNENLSVNEISDQFPNVNRLHWGHMPLIYTFDKEHQCYSNRIKGVELAFSELSRRTNNTISFIEGNNADITIVCYGISYNTEMGEESGYYYPDTNLTVNATINFYSGYYEGYWYPFIELHEILHTFGYEHVSDSRCSIMNFENYNAYYSQECFTNVGEEAIDKWIVEDLINIYKK